jgi:hypothetical protein
MDKQPVFKSDYHKFMSDRTKDLKDSGLNSRQVLKTVAEEWKQKKNIFTIGRLFKPEE